eukprot:CAMPEP_0196168696 /NCGR_PEP_ID=MMETSP0911-20130528/3383_1 /TAXON_ID=49265 /ORGANISM="Thalassiosira rotula, Strain GSO102" /LENGTH=67 /DNA_ID=CAMNT_0041434743 /DNA_START=95 /DNA_END=298 /DNA_ORIENTATION=+
MEDRCPGWQTGECTLGMVDACHHTCPDCGMKMQASTEDYLGKVISAHKKKAIFLGDSQCEKKLAGKI